MAEIKNSESDMITDIDVSYELPVSLIQIRASSQAYLEKI